MSRGRIVRMTRQREIILEELRRLKTHPTADELYQIIKKRLPRISLGTIYRNLDILSGAGVIGRIGVGGTRKRFDGDATNHYHVRCTSCGGVTDIEAKPVIDIRNILGNIDGYQIVDYRLELIGICRECVEKRVSSKKGGRERVPAVRG